MWHLISLCVLLSICFNNNKTYSSELMCLISLKFWILLRKFKIYTKTWIVEDQYYLGNCVRWILWVHLGLNYLHLCVLSIFFFHKNEQNLLNLDRTIMISNLFSFHEISMVCQVGWWAKVWSSYGVATLMDKKLKWIIIESCYS